MFVGKGVAGALHFQIRGRWVNLKSADINAWSRQNKVKGLKGWGPLGKAETQQREQL